MRQYHKADPVLVRDEVRHFKRHLMSYLLVVTMLAGVNILGGGFWQGNWWFLWITLFWGVGLGFHALRLFGDDFGRAWDDRMVAHVVARRSGRAYPSPEGPVAMGDHLPPQPLPAAARCSQSSTTPSPAVPDVGQCFPRGYVPPEPPTP